MDSPVSDSSPAKVDMEPSFRKISTDTANRTYRRPANGSLSDSSSSDEDKDQERSRKPISQKDSTKVKENERDMERRRSYSRTDKDHDRYSDRYSYRESRRHEDKDLRSGRDYARSSRSERFQNLDHKDRSKDREREHERYTSRRDVDSGRDHYYKERNNKPYYDDRRDSRKSPDRYEKNGKVKEKSRYRETDDGEMEGVERRKQYPKENENRKRAEPASSFDCEEKRRETKFSKPVETNIEEKVGSSSKQGTEALPASTGGSQAGVGTDLNAAKVAAMKAAEFVNKNIGGGATGGTLTAEQKKKLLWGNKKNESSGSETVKSWNNLFTDRERQEKFNKLMGVKGDAEPENKTEKDTNQPGKRSEELEMDLEKQYTAGLRRRDGRTVGLGL